MRAPTDPGRQALTGLIVAVAIILTLVCGLALTLSDGRAEIAVRLPTSTLFHITTLPPASTPALLENTPIATIVVIPTSTPRASAFPSPSPTSTATLSPSPSPTPTRLGCQVASGWQPYRIQPGDTIFSIGLRYGLTVDEIMSGNCLTDTRIEAGATLYVPPVTPLPIDTFQALLTTVFDPPGPTSTPAATGTQTATDGACTDPDSVIISPKVGQIITGKISIVGTARIPSFSFYKIEIRQEGTSQVYANLYIGSQQVTEGTLATLDTMTWPNGEYWLRLVVVDTMGNYPERCALLVIFNN